MPKNKAIYDKSGVSSSQLHHDPGHWDTIAHEIRYAEAAEKALDAPYYMPDGTVTTFRKAHDQSRLTYKGAENVHLHPRVEVIDCGGGSAFMWESLNTERRGMYLGHYTNLEYDEKVCSEVSDRIRSQVEKGRAKIVAGSFCGSNWRETADRLIAERGGKRYDVLISLEAVEHLPYMFGTNDEFESIDQALDFFAYMSDYCIISTPNFSERYGKAEDHTREWRFEELKTRLQARFAKVQAFPIRASKSQIKPDDIKDPSIQAVKAFYDFCISNGMQSVPPPDFIKAAKELMLLPTINQTFSNRTSNPAMHLAAPWFKPTSPKVRNILWIAQNPPKSINS